MMATFPTNIDDAFVEGWHFGRYGKSEHHHVMTAHNSSAFVRREYERGVYEGRAFHAQIVLREDCDGQTHVFPRR